MKEIYRYIANPQAVNPTAGLLQLAILNYQKNRSTENQAKLSNALTALKSLDIEQRRAGCPMSLLLAVIGLEISKHESSTRCHDGSYKHYKLNMENELFELLLSIAGVADDIRDCLEVNIIRDIILAIEETSKDYVEFSSSQIAGGMFSRTAGLLGRTRNYMKLTGFDNFEKAIASETVYHRIRDEINDDTMATSIFSYSSKELAKRLDKYWVVDKYKVKDHSAQESFVNLHFFVDYLKNGPGNYTKNSYKTRLMVKLNDLFSLGVEINQTDSSTSIDDFCEKFTSFIEIISKCNNFIDSYEVMQCATIHAINSGTFQGNDYEKDEAIGKYLSAM